MLTRLQGTAAVAGLLVLAKAGFGEAAQAGGTRALLVHCSVAVPEQFDLSIVTSRPAHTPCLTPLLSAAVRSADVIIGSHGATMANAFFARPGTASEWCFWQSFPARFCGCASQKLLRFTSADGCSGIGVLRAQVTHLTRSAMLKLARLFLLPPAVVEMFSAGWTWQVHRIWLDQDPLAQLQWWGLTVEVGSGHPGLERAAPFLRCLFRVTCSMPCTRVWACLQLQRYTTATTSP